VPTQPERGTYKLDGRSLDVSLPLAGRLVIHYRVLSMTHDSLDLETLGNVFHYKRQ
jgi:hypothetical protein